MRCGGNSQFISDKEYKELVADALTDQVTLHQPSLFPLFLCVLSSPPSCLNVFPFLHRLRCCLLTLPATLIPLSRVVAGCRSQWKPRGY
jgi:hypothetical protein